MHRVRNHRRQVDGGVHAQAIRVERIPRLAIGITNLKEAEQRGIEIDFLVPKLYGEEDAPHMHLLGAASAAPTPEVWTDAPRQVPEPFAALLAAEPTLATDPIFIAAVEAAQAETMSETATELRTIRVPAMLKPYLDETTYQELVATQKLLPTDIERMFASA